MSGAAVLAAGAAAAVGCTVWAIAEDVPYSFAVMAGFCMLVSGFCLCAAVLLLQRLINTPGPAPAMRRPNYSAWRMVDELNVSDAARLFCDIEPGSRVSQDTIAWANALMAAIQRGELPVRERPGAKQLTAEQERRNPTWLTRIPREALKSWAHAHGHRPRFLEN